MGFMFQGAVLGSVFTSLVPGTGLPLRVWENGTVSSGTRLGFRVQGL